MVTGQPTAEELAAVTAALAVLATRAAQGGAAAARRRQAGGWARLLRAPLVPGPDAWRRSARP